MNQMFSHIMSAVHTESFLKRENVWSDIVTVEDQIEEHKENGKFDYIEIIHSDEMVIYGCPLFDYLDFNRFVLIVSLASWYGSME